MTMSPTHMRELVERYPGLYRLANEKPMSSCEPFAHYGFTCGDGWFSIVDRLSAKLVADPNLVAVQVKEKVGELRFYVDAFDSAPKPDPVLAERVYAERTAAREESSRTCEICGEPGTLAERLRRWLSVRCESCEWLDEIEEACRRLVDCSEGCIVSRPSGTPLDASRRHLQHIGEAASHQPPERRARLPGIDWERLDRLRRGAFSMSAVEVWSFVLDEVPALAKALR
jgi:ribosomal protein S27AE